jgi:hypothetical protein
MLLPGTASTPAVLLLPWCDAGWHPPPPSSTHPIAAALPTAAAPNWPGHSHLTPYALRHLSSRKSIPTAPEIISSVQVVTIVHLISAAALPGGKTSRGLARCTVRSSSGQKHTSPAVATPPASQSLKSKMSVTCFNICNGGLGCALLQAQNMSSRCSQT